MIDSKISTMRRCISFGDAVRHVKDRIDRSKANLKYYLGGEHFDSGDLHVNSIGVIEGSTIGPAFHMRFKPGHVLLVSRNPHLRKAAMVEFEGVCANTTYVCEAKEAYLFPALLPFIMQADIFWESAERNKRGSTNPYLNWKDFCQFSMNLPSMDQQVKYSRLLIAADKSEQKFRICCEELRRFRSALFDNASNFKKCKNSKEERLIDCFEIGSGQVDPKNEPYKSMILVAPNHIEQGTGRIFKKETAAEQGSISGKYLFSPGDVVYSKIRPNLQKVFLADFKGLCSADQYVLTVDSKKIINKYLLAVLLSTKFTEFAKSRCLRTGIPKINRDELADFSLVLPSISDQQKIVEAIDSMNELELEFENHIKNLTALRKSIVNILLGVDHV